jgi:hypothetical protein
LLTHHLFDLAIAAVISFIVGYGFRAFVSRPRRREGFW